MKLKSMRLLVILLALCLLAGCTGTPVVYYSDCDCPDSTHATVPDSPAPQQPATESAPTDSNALKTGLAILTGISKSTSAEGETAGEANYDITLVAVTVDDSGIIDSCVIDSLGTSVLFDATGAITTDLTAEVLTKNELGEDYGMKAAGSTYEWNEQAAALAAYAVGKTVDELKNGAIDASGKAADADLASTASIYLGGYVAGIEAAVANARHLGASRGDELRLASVSSLGSSTSATGDAAGKAQLDCSVTALTLKGDTITSCYIDAVQAQVSFDTNGAIIGDVSASVLTKNQLGEDYGMKKYAGSTYEWNEQAANFCSYVTGLTLAEVQGIAVDESTKPTEADLSSGVTISIGGFQNLIAKAMLG